MDLDIIIKLNSYEKGIDELEADSFALSILDEDMDISFHYLSKCYYFCSSEVRAKICNMYERRRDELGLKDIAEAIEYNVLLFDKKTEDYYLEILINYGRDIDDLTDDNPLTWIINLYIYRFLDEKVFLKYCSVIPQSKVIQFILDHENFHLCDFRDSWKFILSRRDMKKAYDSLT